MTQRTSLFRKVAFVLGAGVLIVAGGLNLISANFLRADDEPVHGREEVLRLDSQFAQTAAARYSEVLPTQAFESTLGADELFNRRVAGPGPVYELYIARWVKGNRRAFEATQHPPDWCWPIAGWKCLEERSGAEFGTEQFKLKAGEWRLFSAPGQQNQETVFWCLVGGKVLDLGYVPSPAGAPTRPTFGFLEMAGQSTFLRYWRFVLFGGSGPTPAKVLTGRGHQDVYFVRINSPTPISRVVAADNFVPVRAMLAELGLQADGAAGYPR